MAKRQSASAALKELDRGKTNYGDGAAKRKCELLAMFRSRRLPTAREVVILHDALCFLRAYPDDAEVLATVEELLAGFAERTDLRRHASALYDSGIAGTPIYFSFYAQTACWLARRFGSHLTIDWADKSFFSAQRNSMETMATATTVLPRRETLLAESSTGRLRPREQASSRRFSTRY